MGRLAVGRGAAVRAEAPPHCRSRRVAGTSRGRRYGAGAVPARHGGARRPAVLGRRSRTDPPQPAWARLPEADAPANPRGVRRQCALRARDRACARAGSTPESGRAAPGSGEPAAAREGAPGGAARAGVRGGCGGVGARAADAAVDRGRALGSDALPLVAPAIEADVVGTDGIGVWFLHPLYGASVYELAAPRRREIHARLASLSVDVE